MALSNAKVKTGMSGSRGGRSRHEKTEVLKHDSKHRRRIQDREECEEQLICLDEDKTNKGNINMFTTALTNQTKTTNGAAAFKSTESAVLDLFSSGVSSKSKTSLIIQAVNENPVLALKTCLYLRDVRNGQGNRDILRELFKLLIQHDQIDTMKLIVPHLPEIGRWKDVIELIGQHPKLDKKIFKLISKHYMEDNLLAKWLPRQGDIAKQIIAGISKYHVELSHGEYRRHIAQLSRTVEQDMCKNNWAEIDYSAVPSIANKKYANAFERHDTARREDFLGKAVAGEVKMNSSVLYPHQIVNMVGCRGWRNVHSNNKAADALWAQLPNYMEQAVNVLPVIDTSGSMSSQATGTEGSCMDVAVGLGLYFAEHNTGSYKDVWMNFSTNPQAYKLKGKNLSERIANLDYNNWSGSTDINKAFDFVLDAAKRDPEDAPKMIIIVSDMEFNHCANRRETNHEYYKREFAKAGVEAPTVVFWRVNVASGSTPVTMHETGTVLVNGYSPTVLKSILSGDVANYNPYQMMLDIIEPMYTFLDQ